MDRQVTGMVIFSTELYGFNKDQVGKHLAEMHYKYERLFNENLRLKKKMKNLKSKALTNTGAGR